MKLLVGLILAATLIGVAFSSQHDSGYRGHGRPRYQQGGRYKQQGSGYQHGIRYGYKKVSCQKLSDPKNGQVKVSGLYPGDKAEYSCDDGHVLVGLSTRKCLRDGKWSHEAPICRRIDCGPLPDIANGAVSIAPDTRLGSIATYSCKAGFDLVGEAQRECLASGSYSGVEPSCVPVNCGDLSDPDNGWVHISPDTTLGSVAIYRCKLGYQLSSTDRRYCQTDGTWSDNAPSCNPISCGPQPDPDPNGQIASTDGTSLGDKTTYSCNVGFTLEGTATIYCQNNGEYSDTAPKCIPVDCGAPDPSDPNGSLQVSSTTLGSEVVYSCNPGFNLVGTEVATCQEDGEWSSEAPVCEPVDCGELLAPKDGAVYFYPGTVFGSTANFVCRRGFRLVGSSVRTCQANGKWSGVQPVCKKIECPKLKPPKYGKIFVSGNNPGDHAVYDCSYAYKLVGKRRRVCLPSGKWSGSDADCVKDDDHYGGGYYGYPPSDNKYYD